MSNRRRPHADPRFSRLTYRLAHHLPVGLDSMLTPPAHAPLSIDARAAIQRIASASLIEFSPEFEHLGLSKQEPPETGISEGSTTPAWIDQDDDGRSPQCAR